MWCHSPGAMLSACRRCRAAKEADERDAALRNKFKAQMSKAKKCVHVAGRELLGELPQRFCWCATLHSSLCHTATIATTAAATATTLCAAGTLRRRLLRHSGCSCSCARLARNAPPRLCRTRWKS